MIHESWRVYLFFPPNAQQMNQLSKKRYHGSCFLLTYFHDANTILMISYFPPTLLSIERVVFS